MAMKCCSLSEWEVDLVVKVMSCCIILHCTSLKFSFCSDDLGLLKIFPQLLAVVSQGNRKGWFDVMLFWHVMWGSIF